MAVTIDPYTISIQTLTDRANYDIYEDFKLKNPLDSLLYIKNISD